MDNDDQNSQTQLNQAASQVDSENQSTSDNLPTPVQETGLEASVTAPSKNNKKRSTKVIATVLGIILLIGAVGVGVFLVSQQQEIRIGAWDCRNYVFEVNEDGVVSAQNGSTRDETSQQAKVYINGNLVATLDVPALNAGDAATLGNVDVGDACSFSWEVIGTKDCRNSGGRERSVSLTLGQYTFTWVGPPQLSHATTTFCDGSSTGKVDYNEPGDSTTVNFTKDLQSVEGFGGGCTESASRVCVQPSPTQGVTPTPTKIPTPTPVPTLPPIGAACHNVTAYDSEWNLLSGFDLSSLNAGDVVRFVVGGDTDSGFFDKARFTINGTLRPEVTSKRPGTEEFYDEYIIPAGVTSFTVDAQIHHSSLGWL